MEQNKKKAQDRADGNSQKRPPKPCDKTAKESKEKEVDMYPEIIQNSY